jgi:hypothetical protein
MEVEMKITISNRVIIADIDSRLELIIKAHLTFRNQKYSELIDIGPWAGNIPEFLYYFEETPCGLLVLPRAYFQTLVKICNEQNVQYELINEVHTINKVNMTAVVVPEIKTYPRRRERWTWLIIAVTTLLPCSIRLPIFLGRFNDRGER